MKNKETIDLLTDLSINSGLCVCKTCKKEMVGYPGDDICSDCAFPSLRKASEAGLKAVEEGYFKRTGKRKKGNEILRNVLGF